jgi:peptide/nickel transport system permease protein
MAIQAEPAVSVQPALRRRQQGRLAAVTRTQGLSKWLLLAGLMIVAVFVILAVFAPLLAPYDFNQYQTVAGVRFPRLAPPSAAHWFGTDVRSTDVLSVVIYGSRTALEVVALSMVLSILIGLPLGLISGYFGGPLDRGLLLVMDALFSFPYLLLAIVIAFLLTSSGGGGVVSAAVAITIVYVPQYFRVVRNSVVSVREESYVEAARALGATSWTVITRYIAQNVLHSVPVIATLNAADAILTLAGLGFLGYGIEPNQAAEWGYALQRAIPDASSGIWWTALWPGLAIVLLVTGLTLVGEGLNEFYNPVLRTRVRKTLAMPPREPDEAL